MQNTLNYKNYIGSVEFSEEDNILFGKVQGIRSLIMYEGATIAELIADFHNSIDDYLEVCRANNEEPEKSFKGTFNVRVSPETHRNAAVFAIQNQKSLNKVVEEAIEYYLIQKRYLCGGMCKAYFKDKDNPDSGDFYCYRKKNLLEKLLAHGVKLCEDDLYLFK